MQRDADQAMAEGWRYEQIDALRDAGIIRSKFDPSKWVQKQGDGKWKQVYPYGKPGVAEAGNTQVDEISSELANKVAKTRKLQSAQSTVKGLTSIHGDDVARHAADADRFAALAKKAKQHALNKDVVKTFKSRP